MRVSVCVQVCEQVRIDVLLGRVGNLDSCVNVVIVGSKLYVPDNWNHLA